MALSTHFTAKLRTKFAVKKKQLFTAYLAYFSNFFFAASEYLYAASEDIGSLLQSTRTLRTSTTQPITADLHRGACFPVSANQSNFGKSAMIDCTVAVWNALQVTRSIKRKFNLPSVMNHGGVWEKVMR